MANSDKDRRVLDVYYTENGTKIFAENGVLVEEYIKLSPSSQLGIHDNGTSCDASLFPLTPAEAYSSLGESCKSYSYDPPAKEPPMSDEEKSRLAKIINEETIMLAKTALAYYNGKNRTKYKYELVDPVIRNGFMDSGIWFHCNFTATNAISPESLQQGPKLFFAELKIVRLRCGSHKYIVSACCLIDGAKAKTGCENCVDIIQHPSHGFRRGLYHFKPRTLRPRSGGKVARMV